MWSEVGLGLGDEMKKKLLEEYKTIGSVDTCRAAVAKTKGKKVIVRSGEYGMSRREKQMLMKQVINQPSDTHMWIARIRKEK